MLELFNNLAFLDVVSMGPSEFCDTTSGLGQIVTLLKNVITLLKWGIPLGLILFGMLDLGKAVIAGKEDEMKKAQGTLIKRVIYAVAVFLVVTIVTFVMGMLGDDSWKTCWDSVGTSGTADPEYSENGGV